jgi:hypothetical protein
MKKMNPNGSYERNLEQRALKRKRSRDPYKNKRPDLPVRLAIGEIENLVKERQQIQDLVEKSSFSIEDRLIESLEKIYDDSKAKIAQILGNSEVSEALRVAELVSQVSTFEN